MKSQDTDSPRDISPDHVELARRVMEDMFVQLFWEEQACRRIGFKNISRLIGEMPGWYLWTDSRKGAYLLELRRIKPSDSRIIKAYFLLRYYPSPEDPFFKDLAHMERQVRLGSFFDHTGTPRSENRKEIHESLFAVGNLHLAFDTDLQLAKLQISSQDRWMEVYIDGQNDQANSAEKIEVVHKGGIDRNVRGWDLSWDFFDKLILGFCYVYKSPPIGVRLRKYPGVVYYIHSDGQAFEISQSSVHGWALEGGVFLKRSRTPFPDPVKWEKMTFDSVSFFKGDTLSAEIFANPPKERHPWINPHWWMAASWSFPGAEEVHHVCFTEH